MQFKINLIVIEKVVKCNLLKHAYYMMLKQINFNV